MPDEWFCQRRFLGTEWLLNTRSRWVFCRLRHPGEHRHFTANSRRNTFRRGQKRQGLASAGLRPSVDLQCVLPHRRRGMDKFILRFRGKRLRSALRIEGWGRLHCELLAWDGFPGALRWRGHFAADLDEPAHVHRFRSQKDHESRGD